jgi:hypothetical protein
VFRASKVTVFQNLPFLYRNICSIATKEEAHNPAPCSTVHSQPFPSFASNAVAN